MAACATRRAADEIVHRLAPTLKGINRGIAEREVELKLALLVDEAIRADRRDRDCGCT
jgi:hypothetical protein